MNDVLMRIHRGLKRLFRSGVGRSTPAVVRAGFDARHATSSSPEFYAPRTRRGPPSSAMVLAVFCLRLPDLSLLAITFVPAADESI